MSAKKNFKVPQNLNPLLWIAIPVLIVAMMFSVALFPDTSVPTYVLCGLLVVDLGLLVQRNRAALKTRSAAFGLNSFITVVLVIGILGVLNFLANRHPLKWDTTQNKVHTLSDQTFKIVKGLAQPLKATMWSKAGAREKYRPLLDNYKEMSPKFELEYVDPDREPTRAKQAGVKRYDTLQLRYGAKESRVEEPNEEKLTNALIKIVKDKTLTVCATTGHGEKPMTGTGADGFDSARKQLSEQSYEVKEINLAQDSQGGKVPATCDALLVLGPAHAFFPAEVKALQEYLAEGGRVIAALDVNIKGSENAPELLPVLQAWGVKVVNGLVVDPMARMFGSDAAVPILARFNKDHPITKEPPATCYFPFARALDTSSDLGPTVSAKWLSQTTDKSFVVTDFKQLATGQVKLDPSKNKPGAQNVAVAVEGKLKDSKASKATRLVVFGTSQFANNQWSRLGGNLDFFLNSVSWVVEDESLISIRARDDAGGKLDLSDRAAAIIMLVTVILIPLGIASAGVAIWYFRRRM